MCRKRNVTQSWAFRLGLLLLGLGIIVDRFAQLPDSVSCFMMGMASSLLIFGFFVEKLHAMRKFKKKLITGKH